MQPTKSPGYKAGTALLMLVPYGLFAGLLGLVWYQRRGRRGAPVEPEGGPPLMPDGPDGNRFESDAPRG